MAIIAVQAPCQEMAHRPQEMGSKCSSKVQNLMYIKKTFIEELIQEGVHNGIDQFVYGL
jgi:hypothetical protein